MRGGDDAPVGNLHFDTLFRREASGSLGFTGARVHKAGHGGVICQAATISSAALSSLPWR